MKIVSLVPFVSDLFARMGKAESLVDLSLELSSVGLTGVDKDQGLRQNTELRRLQSGLLGDELEIDQLLSLKPSCIITTVQEEDSDSFISWAEAFVEQHYDFALRIHHVDIKSLGDMYDTIERLGTIGSFAADARHLVAKIKAQIMQWAHAFYDRSKGKKVLVLTAIEPFLLAPLWTADIISSLGAKPANSVSGTELGGAVSWSDITSLAPDVIIVAPFGATLPESVRTLPILQKLPGWDELPAVKRGEVGFCRGDSFEMGGSFLQGAAILVSLIAGLDSGYITPRDVYYKLRFVELQRHRFL